MKKTRKNALTACIALALACNATPRQPHRFLHSGTEGLALPILEARYAEDQASATGGESGDLSGRLLGDLFQNQSEAATEAAVVLLGYYLGEADSEDLMHNLTQRGRPILPYLRRYRDQPVTFPKRSHLDSLMVPAALRQEFFDTVIESIEKGEVIGVD